MAVANLVLGLSMVATAGCASFVSGTTQTLSVHSTPSGATASVDGLTSSTPARFTLKRKKAVHEVRVEKAGFEPIQRTIGREVNPWMAGNLLFGYGLPVGVIVDFVSGGGWKLGDDNIAVSLIPTESLASSEKLQQSTDMADEQLLSRADDGDVDAQFDLALFNFHIESYRRSFSYAQKAAIQGSPKAELLIYILHRGNYLPADAITLSGGLQAGAKSADAEATVTKLAKDGDAESQILLWEQKWRFGFIPKRDLHWLKKAVAKGSSMAKTRLGIAYLDGDGVGQDSETALRLFRQAATEGDPMAEAAIGRIYCFGLGVPQNRLLAIECLKKAALKDVPRAQACLAFGYAEGQIVSRDPVWAYAWANQYAAHNVALPTTSFEGGLIGELFGLRQTVPGQELKEKMIVGLSTDQANMAEQLSLEDLVEGPPETVVEVPPSTNGSSPTVFLPPSTSDAEPSTVPPPTPGADQDAEPEVRRVVMSSGTGFFITDAGHLLTNHHVVENASKITVYVGVESYPARIVQAEESLDLAVLKIEKQVQSIPLASSKGLRMGDAVFTIGFPNTRIQGVRSKYTNGRISSLSGFRDDPREFQVSVPIQPGNSGGPLVDERGNVVGIVASSLRDRPGEVRQLVNYAVKSSFALAFLETLTDVVELLPRPVLNQATRSENPIRRVNNATIRIRVERIR